MSKGSKGDVAHLAPIVEVVGVFHCITNAMLFQ